METKEMVIRDDVMEIIKKFSKEKGTSLEEEIEKHNYLFSEERKRIRMKKMSPSLAALVGICGKVPDDYDWKKDVEEELYKEYIK